jgi:uncharacterized protein (DUF433 family)
MYTRFYPQCTSQKAQLFAQTVLEYYPEVSAAQIQGLFMFHKDNADSVIEQAHELSKL